MSSNTNRIPKRFCNRNRRIQYVFRIVRCPSWAVCKFHFTILFALNKWTVWVRHVAQTNRRSLNGKIPTQIRPIFRFWNFLFFLFLLLAARPFIRYLWYKLGIRYGYCKGTPPHTHTQIHRHRHTHQILNTKYLDCCRPSQTVRNSNELYASNVLCFAP